jgi:hypothetical protein
MRLLLTIVVIVVIALFAFNYLTTGKFALLPSGSLSKEQRTIRRLRGEFREAKVQYRQAGRAVALSGVDTASDAAAALDEVDLIEEETKQLAKKFTDDKAREDAEQLLREIAQYKQNVR